PTITCVGEGGGYLPYTGLPCCPGLTPIAGICAVPLPTPDPCAFLAPPTCPTGQMWIHAAHPFCYQCITNPFPSFSPTPSPTPTCGSNLDACFVTPCCDGYTCNGVYCVRASPTPTPTPAPDCSEQAQQDCEFLQVGRVWDPETCNCVNPMFHTPIIV